MFRRRRATTVLLCGMLAAALSPARAGADSETTRTTESSAVLVKWNEIAQATIYPAVNPTPIPVGQVELGFVSMAMYDAVRASLRRHDWKPASASAAAAQAAHDVLVHYVPTARTTLDAALVTTLSGIPAGSAKDRGVAIGKDEAADLLDSRKGDGWADPSIQYTRPPTVGVWRPTTPGMNFAVPWLGFVDPLVLDSVHDVDPGGPDSLTSTAYALDVAEVQLMGAANSTTRTATETQTALFYTFNVPVQMNTALRGMAAGLDIRRAARLLGLANTSAADAAIACWREKFDQPFWRPETAIHEAGADGNARTYADPTWKPLVASPPYPDWTSGHACLMGAYTKSLQLFNHSDRINLVLPSVVNGASVSRTYTSAEAIEQDAFNARIWLGIHFRRAMEGGNALGEKTAKLLNSRFSTGR